MTDLELIEKIKYGDTTAFKELSERHIGICNTVLGSYYSRASEISKIYIQDLMNSKNDLIYTAVLSYNKDKSKFSTYLYNKCRYACLDIIKKNSPFVLSQSMPSKEFKGFNISNKKIDLDDIRDMILNLKDKRAFHIMYLRYFCDRTQTWQEIEQKMKVSRVTCQKIHNDTISFIKEKIKTVDF
jgi:DNA-directed RNA polymerase specialized sigma subunit